MTTHADLTIPTMDKRARFLLLGAASVTVALWASAFVGIRVAAVDFGPGALTLGRIAMGTAMLTVLMVIQQAIGRRRHRRGDNAAVSSSPVLRNPPRRVVMGVVFWGIAWFGIYNLALNAAERHVDAGTAALLVNTAPMITAILAGLFLGEGFPRRLIVGMVISLLGVVVVAAATTTGHFDAVGIALGLAAAVIYGVAATVQKRLLGQMSAQTMTLIGCLAGTVTCLPFLPELVRSMQTAPLASLLALVYLGVFPTAVAFTTWGYVLSRTTAGSSAATTYAVPAVVVLLSWLVLRETPPPLALLGGTLALTGVAVATLRRRRARTERPSI